jgi:hypothetical protein
VTACLGIMSRVCGRAVAAAALAVVLFFVSVNQVLVRLWARAIGINPFGLVEIPLFGRVSDWELLFVRRAPPWSGSEGSGAR